MASPKGGASPLPAKTMAPEGSPKGAAKKDSSFWKWLSLAMMMAQNMLTPLCFRFAATESKSSERFSTPVTLTIMELIKFVLSFLLIAVEEGFSIPKAIDVFNIEVLKKPQDTLALAV